uniref:Predicted protein n=1 Tax=Hordeum vulgare subsp. vulgare TaxID=112509 RepID=F2CTF7_HORVV|nr:predicted protein [Hordeum vulgare subsp. vulgare]
MAASTSATAAVSFSLPSYPRRGLRRLRRRPSLRAASTAAPPSPDLSIQLSPRPSPRSSPPVVPSLARDRADDLQAESRAMTRAAAATVYTPELLASRYGSQPFQVALRAAEVLSKLGAFGLTLLLDQQRGESSSSAKRRARAVELRTILTRLGPTFVKIGQGLSTRPDLCPTEYLEELSELQVDLLSCQCLVLMIRNYCCENTE